MSKVQTFYDEHSLYEWNRLERHRMEFALNMRLLAEYLPPAPARIADVGGGPGRYAIHLAQCGYDVTLFDLSAGNLALARAKAAEAGVVLTGLEHGNALDLRRFADASFDAVLLMGPMYHLLAAAERNQALQESRRILKPGGVIAVAFITRYATVRTHDADWVIAHAAEVLAELDSGVRIDEDGRFTDSYAAHPAEVRPLLDQNGFAYVDMVASEGLKCDIDTAVNHLTGEDWERWIDLSYRLGKDPTVQGAAIHLLAVGRRVID